MKKQLDGLLGMRGLGAIFVVAYHVYVILGFTGNSLILDRTVGLGGCFVPMFFILSGFSCMFGYFDRFVSGLDFQTLSAFYIRRVRRLLPTFWFALLGHCVIDCLLGTPVVLDRVIGSASLLFGFMPQHRESMVDAGWALGIEVVFYLVFPAFVVACADRKRSWVALGAELLLLFSYFRYFAPGAAPTNNSEINFVRHLVYFILGALLYHYIEPMERLHKKGPLTGFLLLLLQVLAYLCLCFKASTPLQQVFCLGILFAAMTLNQIGHRDPLLNNPFLKYIGKYSYPIYLFHMLVFKAVWNWNIWNVLSAKFGWAVHYAAFFLLVLSFSLLLSILFTAAANRISEFFSQNKASARS